MLRPQASRHEAAGRPASDLFARFGTALGAELRRDAGPYDRRLSMCLRVSRNLEDTLFVTVTCATATFVVSHDVEMCFIHGLRTPQSGAFAPYTLANHGVTLVAETCSSSLTIPS